MNRQRRLESKSVQAIACTLESLGVPEFISLHRLPIVDIIRHSIGDVRSNPSPERRQYHDFLSFKTVRMHCAY